MLRNYKDTNGKIFKKIGIDKLGDIPTGYESQPS